MNDDKQLLTMTNKKLSIRQAAKAIGVPVHNWNGQCYGIASAIVDKGLVEGVAIYGHWLGPIAETSTFANRSHLGFVQHGWILLDDGKIMDPTRWVFESIKPYIYVGPTKGLYDEGGNKIREEFQMVPEFDASDEVYGVPHRVMSGAAWIWAERVLGLLGSTLQPLGVLSLGQLRYLANMNPVRMNGCARDIMITLARLNLLSLVPIDNLRSVERHGGKIKEEIVEQPLCCRCCMCDAPMDHDISICADCDDAESERASG